MTDQFQMQPQQPEEQQANPADEAEAKAFEVDALINNLNIADTLEEEELNELGDTVVQGFVADLHSRENWEEQTEKWMELALQVTKEKTFPWTKAANVKYPLLTTAALQFGSRAYPSLVPSFDVVKAKVIGEDESNQMTEIASVISTHMSYQVLYQMDNWEEDMDKLCLTLPILGCVFKKIYYSESLGHNCSELILPKDLVINYWAQSLETAFRKTHVFWLTPNEIIERQRTGVFKEYDDFKFGPGSESTKNKSSDDITLQTPPVAEEQTPRKILEVHTFYDMDDDEYLEPYIITVDYETRKVLRITARFDTKSIQRTKDGKVACIKPKEYFTQFNFIPNPDGGIYGVGFGLLLGSINESANSILNQLIDAGTLSNLQSGFLAKGLRLGNAGNYKFQPGEWKWVNSTMDDLRKGVFPMPVREPSNVLFQLLGMLVNSGKELASISEIMTGKMPGQNTPASTTMATIEQGLKVFTSIYKRIFRALSKEFQKLFELNAQYLDANPSKFAYDRDGVVVSGIISQDLYRKAKVKIIPSSDPNMVSETQKLILQQGLQELVNFGHINTEELTKRALEMQGQPGIAKLMDVQPPGPPPDIQIKMQELQQRAKEHEDQMQFQYQELQSESIKRQTEGFLNMAKAASLAQGDQFNVLSKQLEALFNEEEAHRARLQMALDSHNKQQELAQQQQQAEAQANARSNQGAMG